MAKKNHSDKIHVYYTQDFIDHWNEQPQAFKDKCNELGQDHGYSGQNIFYFFLLAYLTRRNTKKRFIPMQKV